MTTGLGIPKLRHSFTEAIRASIELCAFQASREALLGATPAADGRPVLVLPGFGAGDATTRILRGFLKEKGFAAHGLKGGLNLGPSEEMLRQIKNRLDDVFIKNRNRKVTLIGHSLGGIFARELAHAFPDKVDQVITLGGPFGVSDKSDISMRFLLKLFHIVHGGKRNYTGPDSLTDHFMDSLPVPTSAVYSQRDGVVNWRLCLNYPNERAENIEVASSHCGLVMNPLSMLVILDRLSQQPGQWTSFDTKKYKGFVFPLDPGHLNYTVPSRPKKSHLPGPRIFD